MKIYLKTQSNIEPLRIKSDENSVWVALNIVQKEITHEETIETIWEYDLYQYTKDEYIKELDRQVTDLQLAIVELYGG